MLPRLVNLILLAVPVVFAIPAFADTGIWKKDGITVCQDYPAGVYRPYNTFRKVKLATAYYVNPALPEKSEILTAYSLSDFVKGKKTEELWSALQKGSIRVAAPVAGDTNAFAVISAKDLFVLSALCPTPAKPAGGEKRASVPYKNLVDFSDKGSFRMSIEKVGLDNLSNVIVFSDLPILGLVPKQKYISWDPNEPVNLSVSNAPSK